MRNPDRIDIFRSEVSIKDLEKRWNVTATDYCPLKFYTYWEKYPDQRVGQALINCGMVEGSFTTWSDEDVNILKDLGINIKPLLQWTSYYDKDKNLLDKPIKRTVEELDTDHIEAIMSDYEKKIQPLTEDYVNAFKEILEERKALTIKPVEHDVCKHLKVCEYDSLMKTRERAVEIPFLSFPNDWEVKIIPPFGGAAIRFIVKKRDYKASIYLDFDDMLGCHGSPYWEVYPVDGDTERVDKDNVEGLMQAIRNSLASQEKAEVKQELIAA